MSIINKKQSAKTGLAFTKITCYKITEKLILIMSLNGRRPPMARKDEIKEKISSLSEILHEYHVTRLGLFGSAVRGEDDEKSDIDLLVDFDKAIDLFAYAELVETLSLSIKGNVDLVTVTGLRPELRDKVMSEVEWIERI